MKKNMTRTCYKIKQFETFQVNAEEVVSIHPFLAVWCTAQTRNFISRFLDIELIIIC